MLNWSQICCSPRLTSCVFSILKCARMLSSHRSLAVNSSSQTYARLAAFAALNACQSSLSAASSKYFFHCSLSLVLNRHTCFQNVLEVCPSLACLALLLRFFICPLSRYVRVLRLGSLSPHAGYVVRSLPPPFLPPPAPLRSGQGAFVAWVRGSGFCLSRNSSQACCFPPASLHLPHRGHWPPRV